MPGAFPLVIEFQQGMHVLCLPPFVLYHVPYALYRIELRAVGGKEHHLEVRVKQLHHDL